MAVNSTSFTLKNDYTVPWNGTYSVNLQHKKC
jgi:hypothetical protein